HQQGSVAFQMVTKLKLTKKEIQKWNYEVFGNVSQHIKQVDKKIQETQINQQSSKWQYHGRSAQGTQILV
ncbi:hypothetical protein MKW92_021530, partial [Papaver armeniacum]